MKNLEKLLQAVNQQLGGVPEWSALIQEARKELAAMRIMDQEQREENSSCILRDVTNVYGKEQQAERLAEKYLSNEVRVGCIDERNG